MPKVSEMNPSKWLKAEDCVDADGDAADLLVTIAGVEQEEVGQGAQMDKKWVLYFKEEKKGLVLNKTNTKAIAKIHGDDTDDWLGKRIALYQTEVEFQGETMLGIRVRLKAPSTKKSPQNGKAVPATAAADTPAADNETAAGEDQIPF